MNLYEKTIETISSTKTFLSHIKDLDKIKQSTEDQSLKNGIKNVIIELTNIYARVKVKSIPVSLEAVNSRHISVLIKYCNKCIGSKKPEWQIIAERHGWVPNK